MERAHEESATVVPTDFYDEVLAPLDAPARRNVALTDAARRNRDITT